MFARKFNLDVDSTTVGDPVAPDISLTMLSYTNDTAVLGVELAYRVIHGIAAVLTQSSDNLVL